MHVTRHTSHVTHHTSHITSICHSHHPCSSLPLQHHAHQGGRGAALILTPPTLHILAHKLTRVRVKPPRLVPLLPAALVDDGVESASP